MHEHSNVKNQSLPTPELIPNDTLKYDWYLPIPEEFYTEM